MISEEKRATAKHLARMELAKRWFYDPQGKGDFLDYCYILEPVQPGQPNSGGKVPFQKWEHLIEIIEWLQYPWIAKRFDKPVTAEDRQGVMGKARRRGVSWTVATFAAWLMFRGEMTESLFFSAGEEEAVDLLSKAKYVYTNLPEHWQDEIIKDAGREFRIKDGSRILAFPSTKKAARSYSGSFAFVDEADYHEYIAQAMASIKPIMDTGGQILLGSTIDKMKKTSVFRSHYVNAERIHFRKMFIGYGTLAHENPEHYEITKNSIPEEELELRGLSRELYMEQEFPKSENEMLSSSRSLSFFDPDAIANMHTMKPIQRIPDDGFPDDYQKLMSFWVRRTPRGRYAAGTDVAHGVQGDYSVTVVCDLNSWRVVADIVTNTVEPEDFAEASMDMLEYYRYPIWGIEDNEWGILVIKAAIDRRYPRLFHRDSSGGRRGTETHQVKQPGWHTDRRTRWELWGELKTVIDSQELYVPSAEGILQFGSVIRNQDHSGRPEAMYGAHDDYPMAVGIAYQMRKHAHARREKMVVMPPAY